MKEVAVLKERILSLEKQYAEDRLADKEDLKEIEVGLDELLNQRTAVRAVGSFLSSMWKFAVGFAALTWTVIQIGRALGGVNKSI
jgi:hypothetical protein